VAAEGRRGRAGSIHQSNPRPCRVTGSQSNTPRTVCVDSAICNTSILMTSLGLRCAHPARIAGAAAFREKMRERLKGRQPDHWRKPAWHYGVLCVRRPRPSKRGVCGRLADDISRQSSPRTAPKSEPPDSLNLQVSLDRLWRI